MSPAPAGCAEKNPRIAAALAALELAEQAGALGDLADLRRRFETDANDHQARFDYALGLAAAGLREEAALALLDLIRRDRAWNDDGARRQLLQFFEAWGPADPATVSARKKLSAALFA